MLHLQFARDLVAYAALALCMTVLPNVSSADQLGEGQGFATHFQVVYVGQYTNRVADLYLSNITGASVSVTVNFYKTNGTLVTDDNSRTTGNILGAGAETNYSEPGSGNSATFDLASHATAYLRLQSSSSTNESGYASITWTQSNSSAMKALVGYVMNVDTGGWCNNSSNCQTTVSRDIPINGGLPF